MEFRWKLSDRRKARPLTVTIPCFTWPNSGVRLFHACFSTKHAFLMRRAWSIALLISEMMHYNSSEHLRNLASNLWSQDVKNNHLIQKKVICPHCGHWIPAYAPCKDISYRPCLYINIQLTRLSEVTGSQRGGIKVKRMSKKGRRLQPWRCETTR